jgi:CDP-paratose 2-epimerase
LQEYVDTYKIKAFVNRCGVIAGRGQFGKVDQGVFTLWIANHFFGKPLKYIGFGGTGKQVRDLLHPQDLYKLVRMQLEKIDQCTGETFNVGGGREVSTSLQEWTTHAQMVTAKEVKIESNPATAHVDIPLYISDSKKVMDRFGWKPAIGARGIAEDIGNWLVDNEKELSKLFC